MKVAEIIWQSEGNKESTVTISDGTRSIDVFSYPCLVTAGDELDSPLVVLNTYSLFLVEDSKHYHIIEDSRQYHYEIVGTIQDAKKGIVSVGSIMFDVSPLPGDSKNGDKVQFFADRVDL